jgi:DsbC/DsbD-like thiol-disulfide interchange protein
MALRPAALALALAAALPAAAQVTTAEEPVTLVRLIEGWRQPDGTHLAALEIRLAPGWHTYWRVPGEAGIPPEFDWSGSRNIASVAYQWPRPEVFETYGLRTFGHSERLVLPMLVTPARASDDIAAELAVSFGVCEQICQPEQAHVAARLAADGPAAGRELIEAALADRPLAPAEAGVAGVTCGLAQAPDGPRLTAEVTFAAPPAPGQVTVLESGRPDVWIGSPESRTEGRKVIASARVEGPAGPVLDRSGLRLTVLDPARAIDIRGCDAPG